MSDRLLGISPYLAIAGLLGLALALGSYRAGLGAGLLDYPLSKSQIVARARAFLAAQGIDTAPASAFAVTAHPGSGDNDDEFVARFGLEKLRRLGRSGQLPLAAWTVRFRGEKAFSDIDEDLYGYRVTLSETGDVLGATFHEPKPRALPLARDAARQVARDRLAELGVDLTGYAERTEASKAAKPPAEVDSGAVEIDADGEGAQEAEQQREEAAGEKSSRQRFYFERVDPEFPGTRFQIAATVSASGLTQFSRSLKIDDSSLPTGVIGAIVEGVLYSLLCAGVVVVLLGALLLRLVSRDYASVGRAFVVAAVFILSVFASAVVDSELEMSIYLGTLFSHLTLSLLLAVFVLAAWLAGEADAYFAWGKRCTAGALALLTKRIRARQVARETLEGFLWGWVFIGGLSVAAAVVVAGLGPEAVHRKAPVFALDAHPTVFFWVGLIPYVLFFSVVCLLFLPAWLHRLTKRSWIAIPFASIAACLFANWLGIADVRFGVLPASLSWSLVFGVTVCLLVVRRGFLTATAATFAFSGFYFGLAGLVAGATADRVASAVGLAFAALPPLASFALGARLPEVDIRETPPPRVTKMMEQARREEELNLAQRVQSGLLPASDPSVEGFDIAGTCRPANEVGGDYFDYFHLSDGRFGIAVGDVSGKGIPAAFFMTLTKGFMEVAAAEAREPELVLAQANSHLRDNIARGTFVTMAYAILDAESGSVVWARAGHNPPAFVREGDPAVLVNASGTALGAAPPEQFESLIEPRRLELRRGDTLVFYTDGVTEAMNAEREQFGEERLLATLDRLRDGLSARDLVDRLMEAVVDHAHDADQHDDITIVVVKSR